MSRRSEFLQIRVTPAEKRRLRELSRAAGTDMSSYVLSRALPVARGRFDELIELLGQGDDPRYALAELNDFLSELQVEELGDAVASADLAGLSPFLGNYVAAMVEQACTARDLRPPAWTRGVPPLERPWFATRMKGLRAHLLRSAPVPFRRRNLFVDSSVGDRV